MLENRIDHVRKLDKDVLCGVVWISDDLVGYATIYRLFFVPVANLVTLL